MELLLICNESTVCVFFFSYKRHKPDTDIHDKSDISAMLLSPRPSVQSVSVKLVIVNELKIH